MENTSLHALKRQVAVTPNKKTKTKKNKQTNTQTKIKTKNKTKKLKKLIKKMVESGLFFLRYYFYF
jgi:hypothetical protein